jgi:hypothetical protein
MNRAQYMTPEQKALWESAEKREGRKIKRTHENCRKILGRYITVKDNAGNKTRVFRPGVARPGKTARDRARRRGK